MHPKATLKAPGNVSKTWHYMCPQNPENLWKSPIEFLGTEPGIREQTSAKSVTNTFAYINRCLPQRLNTLGFNRVFESLYIPVPTFFKTALFKITYIFVTFVPLSRRSRPFWNN
ncbi:hypothetical protein Bpfe_017823 [Biomphalaria pfeifferi]|uniref:Uncharacterized protein n=1 Tax=Biomphalaria pfeifferi TaxID=112525 RepID=A0AAD8BDL7_BIOPF|nr:hypothetical protein Bpfe_017823 [Biomphalaria pfeifferi]